MARENMRLVETQFPWISYLQVIICPYQHCRTKPQKQAIKIKYNNTLHELKH